MSPTVQGLTRPIALPTRSATHAATRSRANSPASGRSPWRRRPRSNLPARPRARLRCAGCAGPRYGGPWGARPALVVPSGLMSGGAAPMSRQVGGGSMGKDRLEHRRGAAPRREAALGPLWAGGPPSRPAASSDGRLRTAAAARPNQRGSAERPPDAPKPRGSTTLACPTTGASCGAPQGRCSCSAVPLRAWRGSVPTTRGRRLGRSGPSPHWDGRRRRAATPVGRGRPRAHFCQGLGGGRRSPAAVRRGLAAAPPAQWAPRPSLPRSSQSRTYTAGAGLTDKRTFLAEMSPWTACGAAVCHALR